MAQEIKKSNQSNHTEEKALKGIRRTIRVKMGNLSILIPPFCLPPLLQEPLLYTKPTLSDNTLIDSPFDHPSKVFCIQFNSFKHSMCKWALKFMKIKFQLCVVNWNRVINLRFQCHYIPFDNTGNALFIFLYVHLDHKKCLVAILKKS